MARGGRIFLVGRKEGQLLPMDETPYATEDVLQELLAKYPDLLPGEQITPEAPRRWLLIARELDVPAEEGGSGCWSLDHLFIDQDAVPTFVECKRASDTRNRREVVAQMLDYAANGTAYWPTDRLRQAATETAQAAGSSIDDRIRNLLGSEDADVDAFWAAVETNLRLGHVRLMFVADQTPRELRRLVEFLNEKIADVEVLAVEVKQFLAEEHRVVVPRVIGLTEAAREARPSAPRRPTSRSQMISQCNPAAVRLFSYVLDEAVRRGHSLYWGGVGFSIGVTEPGSTARAAYFYCYPPGRIEVYLGHLRGMEIIDETVDAELRRDFLASGLLQETGKFTLKAQVDDSNAVGMERLFVQIADRMDALCSAV